MTTLERLAAAGLLKEFEHAVKAGARKSAMEMLTSVGLTEAQADAVYRGATKLKRDFGV